MKIRVLEGAAQVFARKGAPDTTVEDILQAASVSRRTFYRFFASKEDALDALHQVTTEMLFERARAAYAVHEPPREKVKRMVDTTLTFVQENRALVRVLHGEAQRPGSPLAARRHAFLQRSAALMSAHVEGTLGLSVDPLVIQGLLIAQEGLLQTLLTSESVTETLVSRTRAAIMRIVAATLSGQGAHLPPLPLLKSSPG